MSLLTDLQEGHEEDALCFLWDGVEDAELVENDIVDTSRWYVHHRAVLKRNDEYVAVDYRLGATELQDNDEEITLSVVKPVETVVTKYVKV